MQIIDIKILFEIKNDKKVIKYVFKALSLFTISILFNLIIATYIQPIIKLNKLKILHIIYGKFRS